MHRHHGDIPPLVHFGTGLAVVVAAAILSYYLHGTSFGRHLEMANLDAWFRFGQVETDPNIAVVAISGDDYHGPIFHRASPLAVDGVTKLIHAVALSGPKVIVIDLDTSEWSGDQRRAAQQTLEDARRTLGIPRAAKLAWGVGGSEDSSGSIALEHFDAQGGCLGVPASIPDDYGVVRGYLPYISAGGIKVPSLVDTANRLEAGQSCAAVVTSAVVELPPTNLIEYSGDPNRRFVHLQAGVLFGTADTSPWQNSNPLKGKIVIIGGQFSEARDRYVTPAGYLDGVNILAYAIASARHGGIPEPSHRSFFLWDLVLGAVLVTGSFFLHRFWMLAISFVAIPFVALAASLAIYRYTGYFMSFMPILGAVFLHHLVEHGVEHWRLKRELRSLRLELRQRATLAPPADAEPAAQRRAAGRNLL
jgi:CHASE2 domain-containing sensor protein